MVRDRFGNWSINRKLRLLIIAAPTAVMLLTAAIDFELERRMLFKEGRVRAQTVLEASSQRFRELFKRSSIICKSFADFQTQHGDVPHGELRPYLQVVLDAMPEQQAQGIYIAFEARDDQGKPVLQWYDRKYRGRKPELGYDFHQEDLRTQWYHGAKRLSGDPTRPVFVSEPYYDEGGTDTRLVSLTMPITVNGRFIGVSGVDMEVDKVVDHIQPSAVAARHHIFTYLVTGGQVLASAGQVRRLGGTTPRGELHLADLAEGPALRRSAVGLEGLPIKDSQGRGSRVFWVNCEIPGRDWKVVLNVPDAYILEQVWRSVLLSLSMSLLGLALVVWVVWLAADHVSDLVTRLTTVAARVEAGDYRTDGLETIVARNDEFGQGARGFQRMVQEVAAREHQLSEFRDDLARRERYFRALIEGATDITAIVDRQGLIRYTSPSLERLLGYDPQELVGLPSVAFVHPEDRAAVAGAIGELVQRRATTQSVEHRCRHKDGSYRTFEARIRALLDDPAVDGIVVNSRDITERKQDLDKIRHLNEDLDRRVQLRTAELENALEQLRSAKEATEQAMKQQEIFLSNVAHDLRTPLTVVIGYSEDLFRRAGRKGQEAFLPDLQLIVNRGKDLLELINDLLNLSRGMSERGVELALEEFDVAAMVRGRMEGIGTIAKKYGDTIEFHSGEGLGRMVADPAKVWRILMNLLTNACKFTKDGNITLTALRENRDGDEWIVFRVADTGVGISAEHQKVLFQRFAQAHGSGGGALTGVGLGLSICLLYCRAMGGEITVASEEGDGSVFTVRLPARVRKADGSHGVSPRIETAGGAVTRGVRGEPRIAAASDAANMVLIIDDDASIADLMRRDLTEHGFRTTTASSGEEGLRMARQLLPSAIILDVVMPGIDGWAVLAALKTDAHTANIPIIMTTMLDERERGMRLGADEFLTKPFPQGRLAELLHKHLHDKSSARILVVEDDADARDRVMAMLREQGWDPRGAADGGEAPQALALDPPDLILLDLMLPAVNGFEVLEHVRQNPAWQSIPVVVMTAAELTTDDRRRLQGRVEQILQKGLYSRDELLNEIRDLVNAHQRRAGSAAEAEEIQHA